MGPHGRPADLADANDESAVILSSSPAVQATYAVTANLTVLGGFNLTTEQQNKIVSIYPVLNSTTVSAQPYSTYADYRGVCVLAFPAGSDRCQRNVLPFGLRGSAAGQQRLWRELDECVGVPQDSAHAAQCATTASSARRTGTTRAASRSGPIASAPRPVRLDDA